MLSSSSSGSLFLLNICVLGIASTTVTKSPHVVVVGAGWGGWGAAKTCLANGCRVTLLDALPDPTGYTPYLTPTGKPFEAGTRGFWQDYPNINQLIKDMNLKEDDIFTPCTNSSFYSQFGLEATAPVFSASKFPILPSPLGQILATFELFERLPLLDRASMFGLLYATIDFTRNEEAFEKYDKMTAYELFQKFGLSKRLVDDFIRPTLLVGLFKPPEELSAAVAMELLYFYALAHQTSFDVRWIKGRSIAETIIAPMAQMLKNQYGDMLEIVGGARVSSLSLTDGAPRAPRSAMKRSNLPRVTGLTYTKGSNNNGGSITLSEIDACVLALGAKGLKSVLAGSPAVAAASPELTAAASLGSIDVIACRLWFDRKVPTRSPANVFSRFEELRGAGGTFFMLDQLQGTDEEGGRMLWGESKVEEGGLPHPHDNRNHEESSGTITAENPSTITNKEPETGTALVAQTGTGTGGRGSVVACDFYNSGSLMALSDADIVAILTGARPAPGTGPTPSPGLSATATASTATTATASAPSTKGTCRGLLPQAVPAFQGATVVDYYIQRYPGAVNHFAPNSYKLRPPLQLADIGNCVMAGDWVRMGSREHGAKGLCQERAFVSGIEAANALARSGVLSQAAATAESASAMSTTSTTAGTALDARDVRGAFPIRHTRQAAVLPVRDDELQYVLARAANKRLIDFIQMKPPSLFPFLR